MSAVSPHSEQVCENRTIAHASYNTSHTPGADTACVPGPKPPRPGHSREPGQGSRLPLGDGHFTCGSEPGLQKPRSLSSAGDPWGWGIPWGWVGPWSSRGLLRAGVPPGTGGALVGLCCPGVTGRRSCVAHCCRWHQQSPVRAELRGRKSTPPSSGQ